MKLSMAEGRANIGGLPPMVDSRSQILILGSFPSEQSLSRREYYANPRNHFWPMMEALFGIDRQLPYSQRVSGLLERCVALWDVIATCKRQRSADSTIENVETNPLTQLLRQHPRIGLVAFNGGKAATTAARLAPELFELSGVSCERFPSTSPAHAISLERKLSSWSRIKGALEGLR